MNLMHSQDLFCQFVTHFVTAAKYENEGMSYK